TRIHSVLLKCASLELRKKDYCTFSAKGHSMKISSFTTFPDGQVSLKSPKISLMQHLPSLHQKEQQLGTERTDRFATALFNT
ncbi:hypothetical protein XEUV354_24055, partial [Xanthomonas euvesicatoria]